MVGKNNTSSGARLSKVKRNHLTPNIGQVSGSLYLDFLTHKMGRMTPVSTVFTMYIKHLVAHKNN